MKNLLKAAAILMVIVMVWSFITAVLAEENPELIAAVEVSAPVASAEAAPAADPAPVVEAAPISEAAPAGAETPVAETAPKPEKSAASELPAVDDDMQPPDDAAALAQTDEIIEDVPISEDLAVDLSNAYVIISCANGSNVRLGETVTLVAQVFGLGGVAYSMQWQYQCGGEWHDVGGANGDTYSYTLTENNTAYAWRLALTIG